MALCGLPGRAAPRWAPPRTPALWGTSRGVWLRTGVPQLKQPPRSGSNLAPGQGLRAKVSRWPRPGLELPSSCLEPVLAGGGAGGLGHVSRLLCGFFLSACDIITVVAPRVPASTAQSPRPSPFHRQEWKLRGVGVKGNTQGHGERAHPELGKGLGVLRLNTEGPRRLADQSEPGLPWALEGSVVFIALRRSRRFVTGVK